MPKYFGTDGIRGKSYEFLDENLARAIGRSLHVLKKSDVIVARDTRESGQMLSQALIEGALEAGFDTIDIGVMPTPALCHISRTREAIGVMITASHNPYQDNGIKIFVSGRKLTLKEEMAIENNIDAVSLVSEMFFGKKKSLEDDPMDIYLNLFRKMIVRVPLSIGLDLANGATCKTAPVVFPRFSDRIFYIGNNPDGRNINDNVGSTHPESLSRTVEKNKLDIGFAFDGDGDRVIMVGNDGLIYDGDMMIYIFACYLKERSLLKKNTVVLTKMSNLGIIKALESKDINVVLTDIGDKYVMEEMDKEGYILGGENSGHIINRLLLDTGDGVLNATFMLKILHDTETTVSNLTKDVVLYPDKLKNLRNIDPQLTKDPDIVRFIEKRKEELGTDGRILVRPSGTEPVIRIAVSAKTMDEVDEIIESITNVFMNKTES
ncbi:MAG TPA: phosphoglucosamine mutase [Bacillota bacterium]|nr:phosphoglucosamine mutase [Bacillota bacterium]